MNEGPMPRSGRTLHEILFLAVLLAAAFLTGCASATASELGDFTSDGCSLFPDGTISDRDKWCDCCLQHDIAYWRGGSEEERKDADKALLACVLERTGEKTLARTMYLAVRAGGHPAFPTWYRWAYGWPYGRGYQPLNAEEQQQAKERLRDYWKKHPEGFCAKEHAKTGSAGKEGLQ